MPERFAQQTRNIHTYSNNCERKTQYPTDYTKLYRMVDKLFHELERAHDKLDAIMDYLEGGVLDKEPLTAPIYEQTAIIAQLPEDRVVVPMSIIRDPEYLAWKDEWFVMMDKAVKAQVDKFGSRRELLKYIVSEMRKDYGFVPEQEAKEIMEELHLDDPPKKMEIIWYRATTWRSIFECKVQDLIGDPKLIEAEETLYPVDKVIEPLIRARNDRSANACATWKMVYKYMEVNKKVSFQNHTTRFKNQNPGKSIPQNKYFIATKRVLFKKFKESIQEIMEGM